MKFVIFHGSFGNPSVNWFPDLKIKLEQYQQEVLIPQFPVDNWDELTILGPNQSHTNQNLTSWCKVIEKIIPYFKKTDKLCFVCHSLGSLFILHILEKYQIQLDSAIFVCPFLDKLNRSWQIDLVNQSFFKTDFNFPVLQKLIPVSYVLFSKTDPYVPKEKPLFFANKLHSSVIEVLNAGHMNDEIGFTKFPLVTDLCLSRLDSVIYTS
jgi:predicted alpha/beta hydrolase family esterase